MSISLTDVGKLVTIYGGIPVLIVGVLGGLLNTLVFLSLRTFRESSCAFYLTIMSILNVGQLLNSLLPRILLAVFNTDGTDKSLFYCKLRFFLSQLCNGASLTCFCLAAIDQYLATCSRPRWQQYCNIKLAQRVTIIAVTLWILNGIPFLALYYHVVLPITNKIVCNDTNYIFGQYRNYVVLLILYGYLPIATVSLFGSLAFHNIQQMAYRTVPLVRRELDKQLTIMVLVQVTVNIFTLLPHITVNAVATNTNLTSDPIIQEKLQFAISITYIIFCTFFAVSIK
jgi:hypothetical protein